MSEKLTITIDEINALKRLQDTFILENINEDDCVLFEQNRERIYKIMFSLVQNLLENILSNPDKAYVLKQFSAALDNCDFLDTEEREWVCEQMVLIMDILEIESSDGLLNIWMYGFDPTLLNEKK